MSKSLDNPINWSFGIGSLFGIRIRLHLLFVLGGLVVVSYELGKGNGVSGLVDGLGSLFLLFLIVLLHEFGHCFGARFTGGFADEILLWPLGGLAYTSPPHKPRAHLITVVAGPAVNVVLLALTGTVLLVWKGTVDALPLNPFRPFQTNLAVTGDLQYWLVVFFTLNFIILLFNLAPVFPLDGGRVLQCLLWFKKGFTPATLIATGVGMVGAIVLGVMGLITGEIMFIGIAFFGYFTCWQQRQSIKSGAFESGNEFGYDFSQGYTSLDTGWSDEPEKKPSFLERRRARKQAVRAEREVQRIVERRTQVDRILEKVHKSGLESLTAKERKVLDEESQHHRTDR